MSIRNDPPNKMKRNFRVVLQVPLVPPGPEPPPPEPLPPVPGSPLPPGSPSPPGLSPSVPPTAVGDAATVSEDSGATAIDVLANDTDPDGGAKSVVAKTDGSNGTVVITGGGSGVTYQPAANFCGSDSFTYTLNGGSSATVTVTVTCVADDPVAVADSAVVSEDSGATAIDVLANDSDPEGDPITITATTDGSNGTVVITGGGTGLTYEPAANFCGSDAFTYTLNGGSTATVSVTVVCGDDDPPVAVDDAATVLEDSGATAINVLANDTDIDGGPMTIIAKTDGANGTVVITGGGSGLTYEPAAGFCGPDSFTYTLNGGSTGTVSVTVDCVDTAPVAVDDTATVGEDAGASAVDVLANDTDTDGGPKSVGSVAQPANGTVVITGGGTGLTYQPNADYCNDPPGTTPDTFTYTLSPGGSTATVSVTVTCVDDPPTAVDDSATVGEDAAATAIDVLGNDTDPDGGPTAPTIGSVTQPANGTVVITGGGTGLTYQPNADYCNDPPGTTPDTFTYTLSPGGSTATVSVTVTCVVDAPTAVDDSATVLEDAAATAIDVLANDTDPDGGGLQIGSVTQPANGTVVTTGGGTALTYQPNLNYCNDPPATTLDTFTYTLTAGGAAATVSVTVTCVDDPPAGVNDSATVLEDAAATAIDVLANDTDLDGGPKTVGSVTQPANGEVVITGGGTGLTYQPDPDYCNDPPATTLDTFTYTLSPGSSTATVAVTVTCTNDPPDGVIDRAYDVMGNVRIQVPVPALLDGVSDPDGDSFAATAVGGRHDRERRQLHDRRRRRLHLQPAAGLHGRRQLQLRGVRQRHAAGLRQRERQPHDQRHDLVRRRQRPRGRGRTAERALQLPRRSRLLLPRGSRRGGRQHLPLQRRLHGRTDTAGRPAPDRPGRQRLPADDHRPHPARLQRPAARDRRRPPDHHHDGGGHGCDHARQPTTPSVASTSATRPAPGIAGTNFGTLTLSEVGISGAGQALNLNTGTANATFSTLTSTSGTNGVALINVAGAVTSTGSSLTGSTGDELLISGGTGSFTYPGDITNTGTDRAVNITGKTGGTVVISGPITDTGGTGDGISLTSNTGATINLTGGVNLSTGTVAAFTATGGGTINVTGAANTLATTTGTALNVAEHDHRRQRPHLPQHLRQRRGERHRPQHHGLERRPHRYRPG